jgi:hypothetical protein
VGVTLEIEPWSQATRLVQLAAGTDVGVAADLAGALAEDEVAAAGEADLGAVAAGAGPVQVEGCGRVEDVFGVDDQEAAGGVLAVGRASWRSRQGCRRPLDGALAS